MTHSFTAAHHERTCPDRSARTITPAAVVAFLILFGAFGCSRAVDHPAGPPLASATTAPSSDPPASTTQDEKKAAASNALPDTFSGAAAAWPVFRGDALANGVAESPLPENLEVLWKFGPKEHGF